MNQLELFPGDQIDLFPSELLPPCDAIIARLSSCSYYPPIDPDKTRPQLLRIMRSCRWFDMSHITSLMPTRHDPSELHNLLITMSNSGLLDVNRHYYGSTEPGTGDYQGFKHIYRIRKKR